jgi:hypothetical protein
LRSPKKKRKIDLSRSIWIVIQHGGSSSELYPHSFDSKGDSIAYIKSAKKASYDCDGPFEISLNGKEAAAYHLFDRLKSLRTLVTRYFVAGDTPCVPGYIKDELTATNELLVAIATKDSK